MASPKNKIPKSEIESLARTFLPDIIAFFESEEEEGKKEYEEWLEQKKKAK
jgi:hypothetical protein